MYFKTKYARRKKRKLNDDDAHNNARAKFFGPAAPAPLRRA